MSSTNEWKPEVRDLRRLYSRRSKPVEIYEALQVADERGWRQFKWDYVDGDGSPQRGPRPRGAHLTTDPEVVKMRDARARGEAWP